MILLLDTSTATCRLTIVNGTVRIENEWEAGRGLADGLLVFLENNLENHGYSFNDIDGIGVYAGPGSYTGLRIGITVANTLAGSLGVAIVSANGLDWHDTAIKRLQSGENDNLALPDYGGDAKITTPRK